MARPASDVILRVIGRQGAAILTRVMGIILTALSVEFVLAGLQIGAWAHPTVSPIFLVNRLAAE